MQNVGQLSKNENIFTMSSREMDKGTGKSSPTKNKLIVAGCIVIVAYYLNRFVQNRGASDPIVQVKNGKVRGRPGVSRGGREFYEFLGIPYAEPPTGELRFHSPRPVRDWKGVLSARRFKPKCMQVDLITHLKSGSDDCLYLNVFMPKGAGRGKKPLPVMAFIHGGYYVSGHPSLYGPKYLMDEDIILVSISYRLGALGFLNLGLKEARGNQGMKDQVLALKWIQENIQQFGGDPNLVTIIGQSAGGSSVHFHMLSKMSKGLFHRAVSHSGTVLSPWAISYSGEEQAMRLGQMLDCPVNDTRATLECMMRKDVNKIVEAHNENLYFLHDPLCVFKPSIEAIDDEDAFLTRDPVELMEAGNISTRVPWLIGVNSEEGLAVASILVRDSSLLKLFKEDWRRNFRNLLLYSTTDKTVPEKILAYYFDNSLSTLSSQSNLTNFTKLFSDREYFLGAHQSALYHHAPEKSAPVYLFYFAQYVPLSFGDALWAQYGIFPAFVEIGVYLMYAWIQRNVFGWVDPNKAVTHVDDFTFLFQIANVPEYIGGEGDGYNRLSNEMVRSWAKFAREGKPGTVFGTEWNQALPSQDKKSGSDKANSDEVPVPQYLKIKIDEPAMVDEPFNDAIRFWKSLNLSVYRRGREDIDFLSQDRIQA